MIEDGWEEARKDWVKALNSKATKEQKRQLQELASLKEFSEIEIIFQVFGWRAPISGDIWKVRSNRKEKMGLNEAVYYLLRVVFGIPLHPVPKNLKITEFSKTKLKELLVVGIENGHVETGGKDVSQSVRSAINEVLGRLEIRVQTINKV